MISSINNIKAYGMTNDIHTMRPSKEDFFKKVDQDGSGSVDKTEFSEVAKELSKRSVKTLDIEEMFSKYDSDGDGALNESEFDTLMKENAPPPPHPMNMKNPLVSKSSYGSTQISSLVDLLNQIREDGTITDEEANNFISQLTSALESMFGVSDTAIEDKSFSLII